MAPKRVPAKGEVWVAQLNPIAGQEQTGQRPVLVVTTADFNRSGLMQVCPITQGGRSDRFRGLIVNLSGAGTQTQGVVQCSQPRTVDFAARQARYVKAVASFETDEVLARLRALLD